MKILIAMPCLSPLHPYVVLGLIESVSYAKDRFKDLSCEMIYVYRLPLWRARKKLWEMGKLKDFDRMLFLGDDIVLKEDTLAKLLENNKLVVSGVYFERSLPHRQMAFRKKEDGKYAFTDIPLDGKLHQVDGVGLDCCLIDKWVVEKIPSSAFYPIDGISGDDLSFAYHLEKEGIPIFLDTRCVVGHLNLEYIEIKEEHYHAWKDKRKFFEKTG